MRCLSFPIRLYANRGRLGPGYYGTPSAPTNCQHPSPPQVIFSFPLPSTTPYLHRTSVVGRYLHCVLRPSLTMDTHSTPNQPLPRDLYP